MSVTSAMQNKSRRCGISTCAHVISFLVCVTAGFLLAVKFKDLSSTPDKLFATISGVAGIYAAIFAIIELLRLRSVASLVDESVANMANEIHNLVGLKNFQDCQHTVDRITQIIDAGDSSPFSMIHELVRSYSYCFATEMKDDTSAHRRNRGELEIFCNATTQTQRRTATQQLRPTLLSITSQLSEATASAIKRDSARKT